MSIHQRTDGAWLVRWRDGDRNSKHRQRVVGKGQQGREDAAALDAEIKRKKRLGGLVDLSEGEQLLRDYLVEWFQWKRPKLEAKGAQYYRYLIAKYIEPTLGSYSLRQLDPWVIEEAMDELEQDGVSDSIRRRCISLLQQILSRAVRQRKITVNPVREVPRPRQGSVEPIGQVLSVSTIEAMRAELVAERPSEALFLSLMAYAGMRPQEALALQFRDIGDQTILVRRKMTLDGVVKSTKTGKNRTIALAYDVIYGEIFEERERRQADPKDWVVTRPHGGSFSYHDYGNWRSRDYQRLVSNHGLESTRPYDLRHTFASLLLSDGYPITEVAENMGHGPMVCSSIYAHVIKDLPPPTKRTPAVEDILAARGYQRSRAA